MFPKITLHIIDILFGISTLFIVSHVVYAGYFIFRKAKRPDLLLILLASLISICLIFLIRTFFYPFIWFFWLEILSLCALLFHSYYKSRIAQVYLREFCNFKIYIEIYMIFLSFLGMVFFTIFSAHQFLFALLTLIFIIRLNILIFKKKKIYGIYYQNPKVPDLPFISIVIIAYNEEEYIRKLLESIKMQGYPKYEVILVDDHSTDRTKEVAAGFSAQIPLSIVQKDVRGASRSRNYGATFAKGEMILFLDADVILPPNFIRENINAFIKQKLSIAAIDFIPITENTIDKRITNMYRIWLKLVQYFNPRGIGFCLFVDKELHNKVLFDESVIMSEDFDYVRRAVQYGKFRILNVRPLEVSWRRFKKENRILLILKYMFFEWYRQNIGEIRRKMLPYEFGSK